MTNPTGERDPPAGTNFTQFHTYGFLWVPATATTKGIMSAYFDGQLVGIRSTGRIHNQAPTPVASLGRSVVSTSSTFTSFWHGVGEQYTLKSVNVWQKDATHNLSN